MFVFALQSLIAETPMFTPAEPSTLQLVLAGLITLAIYAVVTGWRPRRKAIERQRAMSGQVVPAADDQRQERRAA
jgi:hypothetical protein